MLTSKLLDITSSVHVVLPELALALLVIVLLIGYLVFASKISKLLPWFAIVGLVLVCGLELSNMFQLALTGFHETVRVDGLSRLLKLLFLLSLIITIWFNESSFYSKNKMESSVEFYILLISMLLGIDLMIISRNLLLLFLGLELVGLSSFAITLFRNTNKSKEAGIKYLLFGVFSSAIMLYGMSFLYGFTGSLSYSTAQLTEMPVLLGFSFLLLSVGALFKLSGFPFHIWVPDVYEGASLPVVSFFSFAPKVAGLSVLFIFISNAFPDLSTQLIGNLTFVRFLSLIAILTISIGNFVALKQTNVKRLLGYSSIAHAGFLLIAVVAGYENGINSFLFYVITYVVINFTAFISISWLIKSAKSEVISDFAGLGRQYPLLGIIVLTSMVALIGLPPTSGFLAKLYLFTSLWETWSVSHQTILMVLFIVGLMNTVVSLFYYLKIPFFMFFKSRETEDYVKVKTLDQIILVSIAIFIILQFIFAEQFIVFIKALINT